MDTPDRVAMAAPAEPGERAPATDRQRWMAVLARASASELSDVLAAAAPHLADGRGYERLKGPETGTIMIEGRAGGAGRRFNVGEATATRAIVRLACGTMGFAYALGSDRRRCELAALLDGVLQRGDEAAGIAAGGVARLAHQQAERRLEASRRAAATKVDFFTVTRGHD